MRSVDINPVDILEESKRIKNEVIATDLEEELSSEDAQIFLSWIVQEDDDTVEQDHIVSDGNDARIDPNNVDSALVEDCVMGNSSVDLAAMSKNTMFANDDVSNISLSQLSSTVTTQGVTNLNVQSSSASSKTTSSRNSDQKYTHPPKSSTTMQMSTRNSHASTSTSGDANTRTIRSSTHREGKGTIYCNNHELTLDSVQIPTL